MKLNQLDRTLLNSVSALTILLSVTLFASANFAPGDFTISPETGSNPSVTTSIRVAFTKPMNSSSVEGRFSIRPKVDGSFIWLGNTLVFKPWKALDSQTTYSVTVATGSVTRLGVATTQGISTEFKPRSPTILYLAPANAEVKSLRETAVDGSDKLVYSAPTGIDSYDPSPDGSQIAVAIPNSERGVDLWIIYRDGGADAPITHCGSSYCGHPVWSPDGGTIGFEKRDREGAQDGSGSRVWLYRTMDHTVRPLFEDELHSGFDVTWSRNGQTLAYYDPDTHLITVVPLDSSRQITLPSQMGQTGQFSPNGKQMVYADLNQVGLQFYSELWLSTLSFPIVLIPLDSKSQDDQYPSWSPNGSWIAFGRRPLDRKTGLATQLALFDVSNKSIKVVTNDMNRNSSDFRWDPSGTKLLLTRFELGVPNAVPEVWIYTLQDNSLKMLVKDALDSRWIP